MTHTLITTSQGNVEKENFPQPNFFTSIASLLFRFLFLRHVELEVSVLGFDLCLFFNPLRIGISLRIEDRPRRGKATLGVGNLFGTFFNSTFFIIGCLSRTFSFKTIRKPSRTKLYSIHIYN